MATSVFSALACGSAAAFGTSWRADDAWSYTVTPYVCMAGLSEDVGTLPGLPDVNINMSFPDIPENLDFAAFVAGEFRRGNFILLDDISYAEVSELASTPAGLFSGTKLGKPVRTADAPA